MLIALYRWKIKSGHEQQFIEAWSEITLYYRENHGSFGSRLHRGSDGLFYGYAKWPSAEQRAKAFITGEEHPARPAMVEAIEESFPEVLLEVAADLLIDHRER
ncbi:MAG: antibiotic biosynthesis monooxygenase [Pyrinomonadaceae bacterium]